MNELRTDKQTNAQTNERTNEKTKEQTSERTNENARTTTSTTTNFSWINTNGWWKNKINNKSFAVILSPEDKCSLCDVHAHCEEDKCVCDEGYFGEGTKEQCFKRGGW